MYKMYVYTRYVMIINRIKQIKFDLILCVCISYDCESILIKIILIGKCKNNMVIFIFSNVRDYMILHKSINFFYI